MRNPRLLAVAVITLPLLFACDPVTYAEIIIDTEHPLDERCLNKVAEQLRAQDGISVDEPGYVGAIGELGVTRGSDTASIFLNSTIEPTSVELRFHWLGRSRPAEESGPFQLLDDLHRMVLDTCLAKHSKPTIRRRCSARTCKGWLASST